MRVVFLVDMNAFFISCEATRNEALRGFPAAVAGDPKKRTGIILAANYEARARGVKTAMVLYEALRLCPEMIIVPPDHHFYQQKSDEVFSLLRKYSPVVEQNSIDEAWLDMTGTEELFGTPYEAAVKIMKDIEESAGLPCSIGIAENKFLSKMASDMKKPMGITEIWEEDIPTKLWPLPVGEMYGVGAKTAAKLNNIGIMTIGDTAAFDPNSLVKILRKFGREIYFHANGKDDSPVQEQEAGKMKSIGRETTLSKDISDVEDAKKVILELSDDIAATARSYQKKGHTVQITLKYNDFNTVTRRMTTSPTDSMHDIYAAGSVLLEKNWNSKHPVRLVGITLSGFSEIESAQISMFDESETERPGNENQEKKQNLDRAIDKIRDKHGKGSIKRAKLIDHIYHGDGSPGKNL